MHRDRKPANVLVVEVDGKPMPRIVEFGLAKRAIPFGFTMARRCWPERHWAFLST
jgi:hypothetical protein